MWLAVRRMGTYLFSLPKASSPSMVRAPQTTMPAGKTRIVLTALGFITPFSGSENLRLTPTTPRMSASAPAGAFQTPRVASIRAITPATAPVGPTLLGAGDVVAQALVRELQARLNPAGVVVEEARLTHLAYAAEIAQVMLRRQQAEAIIAARQKIVHGAVSMVEMALAELSAKRVVQLDDERKAAMVQNLMTVLCAESDVQPVINAGTLYTG